MFDQQLQIVCTYFIFQLFTILNIKKCKYYSTTNIKDD